MDDGAEEVVQVIMQDDGQIVMPEGQFIQLDADNSEMQYIQVLFPRETFFQIRKRLD